MFSLQARAPMQLSWRRPGFDGHHHRRLEFSQFSIEDLKRPDVHHPVGNNFTLPSPYQGARMTGSNYIIIDSRWLGSCDPMFFQNQKKWCAMRAAVMQGSSLSISPKKVIRATTGFYLFGFPRLRLSLHRFLGCWCTRHLLLLSIFLHLAELGLQVAEEWP